MNPHLQPAPSILIAEDSPTQAAQIVAFLTERGYAVHAARNGEEAYQLARTLHPDIIISDIVMPGIDGYELCRRLKTTDGLEDTPVILVTSLSKPQDVLAGLEAGADNFIIKPYDEEVLGARISYLLRNRSLRRPERSGEQIEVEVGGERHRVTARKQQILDLLISTYAQAVHLFSALDQGRQELSQSYEALQALYEMSDGLNRCRTPADVAVMAVTRCLGMPGVRGAWFYLRTETGVFLASERHATRAAPPDPFPPALDEDQHHLAADEGGHVVLRSLGSGEAGRHASLKLQVGPQVMGYLSLTGTASAAAGDVSLHTLGAIASQLSIALERAILHTELETLVRKRTQRLMEEIEERRQATETITAIFNASPVALVSLDSQLKIATWNRAATEIFHAPLDAMSGRPWSVLFAEEDPRIAQAIATIQAGTGAPSFETDCRLSDQTLRTLRVAGEPLIDAGGILRGAVLAVDDITDIKHVKERLHHAQKMEAVGNLTGGIAHDFNNMLTTIIGNLDLAMLQAPDGQKPALDTALRASLRGSELTKKLLAFARKQPLEPKAVDPAEILDEVRLLLDGRMAPLVTMTLHVAPDVPRIYADPTELETALINLAINARDAMPAGGSLSIDVQLVPAQERESTRDWVEFVVVDTGVGIPADKIDRIFEPFFTTKEAGKGTGLGLAMVYGFANQSGGYLTVESEPGVGSTFRLGLPVLSDDRPCLVASGDDGLAASGPFRALLMGPDDTMRSAVADALARAGHAVAIASDSGEAQQMLGGGGDVDFLVADIDHGSVQDLAFVRTMLAEGRCRRALVISPSRPDMDNTGHGGDDYGILLKPFCVEELSHAITNLV